MKYRLFIVFLIFAAACSEEREWDVAYEANKLDSEPNSLRVTYTAEGGRDVQKAPVEGNVWLSDTVHALKEGTFVRMKVERITGNSLYDLTIYRGKGKLENRRLSPGQNSITVNGEL